MHNFDFAPLLQLVENSLDVTETSVRVTNQDILKINIDKLVYASAIQAGTHSAAARFLIRGVALDLGIYPSSIHDLYISRGRNEVPPTFCVPAINLRVLPFEAARSIFRVAKRMNTNAMIFEIARSEIGYTDQRPSEYTSNILGAAIAEGYRGPVFLQGDHFQLSLGRFQAAPVQELQAVKDLIAEAIHAGFYNIDIDASTLVDLSKGSISEQQELNYSLSAELTAYIRKLEPANITVSVGGEIGEVGGHNSTVEELREYANGFNAVMDKLSPTKDGLSKISIQTGTSHGGVVLPDGSIAQVSVDFDTLLSLSKIAREDYGMAGAVQHGASTLPPSAFHKFVEAQACEVHLATNFQNIFFDYVPDHLKEKMYQYLKESLSNERKSGMTDDQFYYKARKRALGPFKKEILDLSQNDKEKISMALEKEFTNLFTAFSLSDTRNYVDKHVTTHTHLPSLGSFFKLFGLETGEEISDLAD